MTVREEVAKLSFFSNSMIEYVENIKEKNKSENILKEKSMSYDFDFNNYKKYGGRDYPDMNSEDYDYEFSDDFDFDDFEDDIFGL